MNKEDFDKKAKELRDESVTAQARLTELTSPTNTLSSDHAAREQQFVEVQEATVNAKKTSTKYNLFLTKYAEQCAAEEIEELFPPHNHQTEPFPNV